MRDQIAIGIQEMLKRLDGELVQLDQSRKSKRTEISQLRRALKLVDPQSAKAQRKTTSNPAVQRKSEAQA